METEGALMGPLCGILTIISFQTCVLGLQNTVTARKRLYLDNKVTPERLLWERPKRGASLCVGECAQDPACVSTFYNKVTGKCQGHSVTFGVPDASATVEMNSRYSVQSRGEGYIMDSCTVDAECTVINSICWQKTGECMCDPGYSFSPNTRECLSACPNGYGPLFMPYHDHYIHSTNMETINAVTLEECYGFCVNRTNYTCKTLEYMAGTTCFLANITRLDDTFLWTEDTKQDFDVSYYQRDCA
ncbi:uncharacterized protein LOC128242129 isoform X1 [Mya arenaria]|uniref:uncharacterized protein LOC128242129 isoform X1 n=1 Tax=Mya arenaria TaxID=6604 RepID=UPI0022E7157A|nr:uncharacterized protein LOC128242129 isoform X1 [Mya arenaria]